MKNGWRSAQPTNPSSPVTNPFFHPVPFVIGSPTNRKGLRTFKTSWHVWSWPELAMPP